MSTKKKPGKHRQNLSFSLETAEILKNSADALGLSMSAYLTMLIREKVEGSKIKLQALPPAPPSVRRNNGGR